jgi:hypothetical protein
MLIDRVQPMAALLLLLAALGHSVLVVLLLCASVRCCRC